MANLRRGTRTFFTGTAALFCACAGPGMYTGPAHDVRAGASDVDVTVVDLASGKTMAAGKAPLRVRLDAMMGGTAGIYKGGNFRIMVSRAGESKADFAMKFGNVNFGGVVRWIVVDAASGAAWQIEPRGSGLEYVPAQGEVAIGTGASIVVTSLGDLEPAEYARKKMTQIKAGTAVVSK